jgi:hypothetical protein
MSLDFMKSKADLADLIKRRLGEPEVKVELSTQKIYDAIDYAKQKWIKWGAGNSKVETYFTVLLLAGRNFYDLPLGVTDIMEYDDKGSEYGINTLFTVDNFLYSRGVYDPLIWTNGYAYTLVSYHIAKDFLETVDRYTPSIYNYKYHKYTNQLEVQPAPPSGNALDLVDENGVNQSYDSPGFILVRSYMLEGSHYAGMKTSNQQSSWKRKGLYESSSDSNFFTSDWIFDYAIAECKIMLGMIRRKFAQFTSIGNVGISLDGSELIQEGKEEKDRLEERLRIEEQYEGYGISIG